jgi:serine/threonine protein kinase/tetratricopeptide (TPR) repeat protein
MALHVGERLGPYEILGLIGAGGMGEVYRARDTRLDRTVAIKVIPEELAAHKDRLKRFEQVARATAALSHPNVLALFDVGVEGDIHYIVEELLEEQTLRDRMRRERMPVREAVDGAVQIARSLPAAHEHGIVHREPKPENVFLTRDGRVKVLDFGLVKLRQTKPAEREGPTATATTDDGTRLGTVDHVSPEGSGLSLPPASHAQILKLYQAGLFLQAYQLARQYGPLEKWQGTPARVLAGRLAMYLGGRRMGCSIHLRAVRGDPRSPEARYYGARALLDRQGAAFTWARMRSWGELGEDAPAELRADWLALQATVLGRFRDFDAALVLLRRAEVLAPGHPWPWIERAGVLEGQDRYAEALDAVQRALRLRPQYPPGVQALARLLLILGRGDEACAVLSEAAASSESGPLIGDFGAILAELRRFRESLECLDRFEALSPLLDHQGRRWLAARRSDTLYELGDLEGAQRQATLADNRFHDIIAARLARGERDARRVLLPVVFVQQHHRTCTPASLASIGAFWCRPFDQLTLAKAITYDGTPRHRAREWAAENGWTVREFRVTWESACALLDRGIPFVLATAGANSGHDQAVAGYDACRGTLYVREPSQPFLREFLPAPFLEAQKWSGPRGFVLLPLAERARLADVELPDAEAHDNLHEIQVALSVDRRDAAGEVQRRMENEVPEHPLTLWATALVAAYDSDEATQLQCIERLLARFPDTPSLLFRKLSLLENVAPRPEYRRLLAQACAHHPRDLPLLSRWAHELSLDAREHPGARRLLRTILRREHWPTMGPDLLSLASICDAQGRADEALELRRFAASFEDMNEGFASNYFGAARTRNRSHEALALLRGRFERLGSRSGHPVWTLFWALDQLGQRAQAFEALERALLLRPADGDLLLFAADANARCGLLDKTDALLSAALGRTRRDNWLRTAARTALPRARPAQDAPRVDPKPARRRPVEVPWGLALLLYQVLYLLSREAHEQGWWVLGIVLVLVLIAIPISAWIMWRRRRPALQLDLHTEARPRNGGSRATATPSQVGRYRILSELGRRPPIVFYRARDFARERDVLLRVLRGPTSQNEGVRARFFQEGVVASRLRHPNIMVVYDLDEHEGMPYMACEQLLGVTLLRAIETGVSPRASLAIMVQTLAGLGHAHETGVADLDIRPVNILIQTDGLVKIIGFGLPRPTTSSGIAVNGDTIGTPDYMSPEQVKNSKVDGRSDLFGVGSILYELLAGRRPFRSDTVEATLHNIIHKEPNFGLIPAGAGRDALLPILKKSLAKDPDERYPDARAMSEDLWRALAEVGTGRANEGTAPRVAVSAGPDRSVASEVTVKTM